MTPEQLAALETGDIIRGGSGQAYVVLANYGPGFGAVAVQTVLATNPSEWTLVRRAGQPRRKRAARGRRR